jgi:hypothetical protein
MVYGRGGRDKRVPIRLAVEGWPKALQRGKVRNLFVHDPAAIADPDADWEAFTRAMSQVNIGGTAKITWPGRQADADRLLMEHVDTDGAHIVEMGASDGTTAVDLIERLGDRFASYTITDRWIRVTITRHAGVWWVWRDGRCIVASNGRVITWPDQSAALTRLLSPLMSAAARGAHRDVLMLNPTTRAVLDADPRVTWLEHDVFTPLPEPVDVIKVGNLLRRVYFTDDQIRLALRALHAGLVAGGHLLIADHLTQAAAGLYRKTPTGFEPIAETARSEIHELVAS